MRGNTKTDRKGIKNPNYKDGRKGTRLYRIWNGMIQRCENSNHPFYPRYGGRGISICEEWHDFKTFNKWAISNGYREDLTIDRIDNNGNYEPSNCRWVTNKIQANNRNSSHLVTINGKTLTLSAWCEIYGINYKTVRDRLKRGWSYFEALTAPIQMKFRKKVV